MFVCIAGKNNIAVDVLEYLLEKRSEGFDIGVICNKTETGKNTWQKSLRFFAERYGIREYSLNELYNIRDLIFISLEYDSILNPTLFLDARLYNIHFSLLPFYKGMYTSAIPILNDESYVGVTLHEIDSGIDTGDIIAQYKFELKKQYTCRDLYRQYIKWGTKLVIENIEKILENNVHAKCQSSEGSSYYSKKYIDYSNIKIDLQQTAYGIDRQVKAYSFQEYQLPIIYGKKVIGTQITNKKSKNKIGSIIAEDNKSMTLATIDYDIILFWERKEELFAACRDGNLEIVQDICLVGEHLEITEEHGWTPLIVATYNNQVEVVKYLLKEGANMHVKNYNGTNLLMYAKDTYLNKGDNFLFKLFYKLGIKPEECDYYGRDLYYYLDLHGGISLTDLIE